MKRPPLRKGDPLYRSTISVGRSSAWIYAIVLREHAGIVKIGRTKSWKSRVQSYATWNLSAGDAVKEAVAYLIHDESPDLERIEAAILSAVALPLAHGREWFRGTLDDARRAIETTLDGHGLSFALDVEVLDA